MHPSPEGQGRNTRANYNRRARERASGKIHDIVGNQVVPTDIPLEESGETVLLIVPSDVEIQAIHGFVQELTLNTAAPRFTRSAPNEPVAVPTPQNERKEPARTLVGRFWLATTPRPTDTKVVRWGKRVVRVAPAALLAACLGDKPDAHVDVTTEGTAETVYDPQATIVEESMLPADGVREIEDGFIDWSIEVSRQANDLEAVDRLEANREDLRSLLVVSEITTTYAASVGSLREVFVTFPTNGIVQTVWGVELDGKWQFKLLFPPDANDAPRDTNVQQFGIETVDGFQPVMQIVYDGNTVDKELFFSPTLQLLGADSPIPQSVVDQGIEMPPESLVAVMTGVPVAEHIEPTTRVPATEMPTATPPLPDQDGDGTPDAEDEDRDGDMVSNTDEEELGSDPNSAESTPSEQALMERQVRNLPFTITTSEKAREQEFALGYSSRTDLGDPIGDGMLDAEETAQLIALQTFFWAEMQTPPEELALIPRDQLVTELATHLLTGDTDLPTGAQTLQGMEVQLISWQEAVDAGYKTLSNSFGVPADKVFIANEGGRIVIRIAVNPAAAQDEANKLRDLTGIFNGAFLQALTHIVYKQGVVTGVTPHEWGDMQRVLQIGEESYLSSYFRQGGGFPLELQPLSGAESAPAQTP